MLMIFYNDFNKKIEDNILVIEWFDNLEKDNL